MKKLATGAVFAVLSASSILAAATAAADPGAWVGPFSSDWTCGQKADSMGLSPLGCEFRSGDARGDGYYFYYQP